MNSLAILPETYRMYNGRNKYFPAGALTDIVNEAEVDRWQYAFEKQFEKYNPEEGLILNVVFPPSTDNTISIETGFLKYLQKEWELYRNTLKQTPVIKKIQVSVSGQLINSATIFKRLQKLLLKNNIQHPGYEFEITGYFENYNKNNFYELFEAGCSRLIIFINDNSHLENVISLITSARTAGIKNVDISLTLSEVLIQNFNDLLSDKITYPNRIIFSRQPFLDKIEMEDITSAIHSINEIFKNIDSILEEKGYYDICMGYYVLPNDPLFKPATDSLLWNILPKCEEDKELQLGLGPGATTGLQTAFSRNISSFNNYKEKLINGKLPVSSVFFMNDKLLKLRLFIENLREYEEVSETYIEGFDSIKTLLSIFSENGLINTRNNKISISKKGQRLIPLMSNLMLANG